MLSKSKSSSPEITRKLSLREKFADLREKVRAENLALKSQDDNEKKRSKRSIGGWVLNQEQIKYLNVTEYRYNASAGSILEILFLQKFWTWLSNFIPLYVAPNTITAIGFFINLFCCSLMIYYSPDARSTVPSWTLIVCALGVFLYQIADALDGKQCYKVQNSQLEEFYDHGCDSVSTILLMYCVGITIKAGNNPSLFLIVIFTSLFAFYTTHWLNYITQQMIFGKIDVTEAQWTMIFIHVLSAIFGQEFWSYDIFGFNNLTLQLRTLLSLMTILTLTISIVNNISIILFNVKTPLERAGIVLQRKHCNKYFGQILKPIWPAMFLIVLIIYCYNHGYYHLNPTMFVLAFGFNFAKLTMKLVVAHCTNSELELLDLTLLAPILLSLNDICCNYFFKSSQYLISNDKALLCVLFWDAIELMRYFTFVSWDIRVALDCFIFNIKYKPGHPKSRLQTGGFYINGLNNQEILNKKQI